MRLFALTVDLHPADASTPAAGSLPFPIVEVSTEIVSSSPTPTTP
jgi:hypothetical protein